MNALTEEPARPRQVLRLLCVSDDPAVGRATVALAEELPAYLSGLALRRIELSWLPDAADLALTILLRRPDAILLDLAAEGAMDLLEGHAERLLRGMPGIRPVWFCLSQAHTPAAIPPAARKHQVGQLWKPLDVMAPQVVARGVREARLREADVLLDRVGQTTETAPVPPSPPAGQAVAAGPAEGTSGA